MAERDAPLDDRIDFEGHYKAERDKAQQLLRELLESVQDYNKGATIKSLIGTAQRIKEELGDG